MTEHERTFEVWVFSAAFLWPNHIEILHPNLHLVKLFELFFELETVELELYENLKLCSFKVCTASIYVDAVVNHVIYGNESL